MAAIHRTMPGAANEPVTADDLTRHNAENDLYRVLHGHDRVIPTHLLTPEAASHRRMDTVMAAAQRPAHDKAAEQAWRENTGRQPPAEMSCTCGDEPRTGLRFTPQFVVTPIAIAAVVFAVCWILALPPKVWAAIF